MKKVKLALVGCGKRGICVTGLFKNHPLCEVTVLSDKFANRAEDAKMKLSVPDAVIYTDYEKMLRDADVDAVFIASDPLQQVDMP